MQPQKPPENTCLPHLIFLPTSPKHLMLMLLKQIPAAKSREKWIFFDAFLPFPQQRHKRHRPIAIRYKELPSFIA